MTAATIAVRSATHKSVDPRSVLDTQRGAPRTRRALVIWMIVRAHRQLRSRSRRWLLYPVMALMALAAVAGGGHDPGDVVDTGEATGTVEHISLRATRAPPGKLGFLLRKLLLQAADLPGVGTKRRIESACGIGHHPCRTCQDNGACSDPQRTPVPRKIGPHRHTRCRNTEAASEWPAHESRSGQQCNLLQAQALVQPEHDVHVLHRRPALTLQQVVDRRDHERAEVLYRTALDINRQALGNDHPQVGMHVQNLAFTLQEQGKLEQAAPLPQ
mgnify:CR=1 FL=1